MNPEKPACRLLPSRQGCLGGRGARRLFARSLDLVVQHIAGTQKFFPQVRALHGNLRRKRRIVVHADQLRLRRIAVVRINAPLLHIGEE